MRSTALSIAIMIVVVASAHGGQVGVQPDRKLKIPLPSKITIPPKKFPPPDLKAETFIQRWGSTPILCGRAKNVGSQNYVSGANQQSIRITSNRQTRTRSFGSLNIGETGGMACIIPALPRGAKRWGHTPRPAWGECNSTTRLNAKTELSFDLDIRNDGNLSNDDSNASNNTHSKWFSVKTTISCPH